MRLFAISARRAGFNTHVIQCPSTEEKPRTLAQAICSLGDDEIVCATDAFDVLCTNTPQSVIEAFFASGYDLMFGAERSHYHHFASSVEKFDSMESTSPYRYLNGGVFTGFARSVRQMLDEMRSWDFPRDVKSQLSSKADHFNDQTLFGRYAALHPDRVGLDRGAAICWNVADEWDEFAESLAQSRDPFVNPVTGTRPAFLHISHLRKYYPAYLWAARRLGLPINGSTVVLRLFDQHIQGYIPGVDSGSIPPDAETTAILNRTLEYRAMKLMDRTRERLKRARMDLGRRRRQIFHRDTA